MKRILFSIIVFGLWSVSGESKAQSNWMGGTSSTEFNVEWDKPIFNGAKGAIDYTNVTGISTTLLIDGRLLVSKQIAMEFELPASHMGYKNYYTEGKQNSTVIGNLYLGSILYFQMNNRESHLYVQFGVRIPTTPEFTGNKAFGHITGIRSVLSSYYEAFLWDTWSVPVIANYQMKLRHVPGFIKMRLGAAYDIFTRNNSDMDDEFHVIYGISGLVDVEHFQLQLGLNGRRQLFNTNNYYSLANHNSFAQIRGGIAYPIGKIVPGLYVRLPINKNYRDSIHWGYGLSILIRR